MSELLELGVADGESRWIGVRRHQAVFVIAGMGLVGEWITQVHGVLIELVIGALLLAGAAPTSDGLTVAERLRIAADFALGSRWTVIRATKSQGAVTIEAHGAATVSVFELQHRGRLDLSGRDQLNAQALAEFADALATNDETQHFSVHVRSSPSGTTTLLAAPLGVSPPTGWVQDTALTLDAVGQGASWSLERWSYLRNAREVIRVMRVRDFSAVPEGQAFLERLQFASPTLDVVVHIDVVGGVRAHRLAARAVHRVGSDDVTSQAAGFRRTAQSTRALERLRQRESLVVGGTALMRIAVFVVIRATNLAQLRREIKAVNRATSEAGLRCEPGFGRQSRWYCAQLPGAPGW